MPRRRAKQVAQDRTAPKKPRKPTKRTGAGSNTSHRRVTSAAERGAEAENMRLALVQRCRRVGWEPNAENLRLARAVIMESHAGRVIAACFKGRPARSSALVEALTHVRRVRARFLRAIAAPSPHATNLPLDVAPDPLEVGEIIESQPERLTDEEEAARARAAMANLERWLAALPKAQARAVMACGVEDHPCADPMALLLGLRAISQHLKGTAGARRAAPMANHVSLAGMGIQA